MSFIDYYLDNVDSRKVVIANWLNGIKKEDSTYCWDYFRDFNFDRLNEETKIMLMRVCIYIEYSFNRRFGKCPEWCQDERLILDKVYTGRGYDVTWLLYAPQEMFNHNCFFDPNSLIIM